SSNESNQSLLRRPPPELTRPGSPLGCAAMSKIEAGPARGRRRRPAGGAPIVRRNTVRLPPDVARRVRLGHPWVYREALGTRPLREEPGAVLELVDGDGEFVG